MVYNPDESLWRNNDNWPLKRLGKEYTIVPDSGFFGEPPNYNSKGIPSAKFLNSGSIPSSFSNADFDGIAQQTFLGATILDFSISAGYGDTSSQLSVNVINDEYNVSDRKPLGLGNDIYHSGNGDRFNPPPIGSPVFFHFGKGDLVKSNHIWQWNASGLPGMDDWMSDNGRTFIAPDPPSESGKYHLCFGGILQGWTQNRSINGNTFSVNVVDPRQILSNVTLILNNYAEGTYKTENIVNVYGFLEHNPSEDLLGTLQSSYSNSGLLTKTFAYDGVKTVENPDGTTSESNNYTGGFTYIGVPKAELFDNYEKAYATSATDLPEYFPMTGTGMSRRTDVGIPFYRVIDALYAQMRFFGDLPQEYVDYGFEVFIRFRGYNYVLDLGSLPINRIPRLYYLEFEEISLLDFIQEICDITNHELFVSLLPIVNHPKYSYLQSWNYSKYNHSDINERKKLVAGVIRIDAIDRTAQMQYGKISEYIRDELDVVRDKNGNVVDCTKLNENSSQEHKDLCADKQSVTSSDIGFELTDATTEKFVAGANEVEMYFFTGNADRDTNFSTSQQNSLQARQYKHQEMLTQQILPYYGMLGFGENKAVTIPRGFGAYQQILLDTTGLNANGVGSYYVATEMEMRCAMISYERWKEFLLMYSDVYMESVEENDAIEGAALSATPANTGLAIKDLNLSNNYAVTVPRCVFESDRNYLEGDGLPASPCAPPYGYPLYYKRAFKIGIPEGGFTKVTSDLTQMITNLAKIKGEAKRVGFQSNGAMKNKFFGVTNTEWNQLYDQAWSYNQGNTYFNMYGEQEIPPMLNIKYVFDTLDSLIKGRVNSNYDEFIGLVDNAISQNSKMLSIMPRLAKKADANAKKVYNFIKNVAEECLGKKFLVKIPKYANPFYKAGINITNGQITQGPFGFKPRPHNADFEINGLRYLTYSFAGNIPTAVPKMKAHVLDYGESEESSYNGEDVNGLTTEGALKSNYNPISDKLYFNYVPSPQGGFFDFDIYSNVYGANETAWMLNNHATKMPSGVRNGLVPRDLTPFISEEGRVSAYVRFDYSNYLSFDSFNASDYTQQKLIYPGMIGGTIPDVSYSLDNVGEDMSFADTPYLESGKDINPENFTSAFVKCQLDEKYYMPPMSGQRTVALFGKEVIDIGAYSKPRMIFDEETCKMEPSFTYYLSKFIPHPTAYSRFTMSDFEKTYYPEFSGSLINTNKNSLDTNNVYALITLPARPVPLKDIRFRDAIYFSQNPVKMKHLLTQDVIKDPSNQLGFQEPSFQKKPTNILRDLCEEFDASTLTKSFQIYKEVLKGATFGLPQRLHVAMPSPVYPDMVSLSLESKERAYGPWITTMMNSGGLSQELVQEFGLSQYRGIGGKLEFIRDENLAPWNYQGHDLMNEAGRLKASFGNSLSLHSERGGFVFADAPSGMSIARALKEGGSLVTSIDVSVSTAGIQTTVKLDTFTAQFGKLDRQKEIQISKMSRERQKLRDMRNQFIRRGIGKSQTSLNYGELIGAIENSVYDSNNRVRQRVANIRRIASSGYLPDKNSQAYGNNDYTYDVFNGNTENFGSVDEQQTANEAQFAAVKNDGENEVVATRDPEPAHGAIPIQFSNEVHRYTQYIPESEIAANQGWAMGIKNHYS